jgi:hypothetical protein
MQRQALVIVQVLAFQRSQPRLGALHSFFFGDETVAIHVDGAGFLDFGDSYVPVIVLVQVYRHSRRRKNKNTMPIIDTTENTSWSIFAPVS